MKISISFEFRITIACLFYLVFPFTGKGQGFYLGADLSYVHEMEDCGAVYTEMNEAKDPFLIMKDHGCNLVRLRLWHTPTWYDPLNQGQRYSDFADVKQSIYRAQELGMSVLLDFHLSDTWADPSHQVVPAAWSGVVDNLPVLQDSLYQYIYRTLFNLAIEGHLPEMVQVGNETNKGILLSQQVNDQGWSVNWARNAALFNSAIDAVRDVEAETSSSIQVALHIADPSELDWWMNQFWIHGVQDFDIIGLSYYHAYHQDLLAAVGAVISDMKATYPGKQVMILETAYPWTSNYEDGAGNLLNTVYPGYPFSPQNQEKWLVDLTQIMIDHGGKGVVYWEPGWVSTTCYTQYGQGSNWENCTFFDFDDHLLNDGGIGWMSHTYQFASGVFEIDKDSPFEIFQLGNEIRISWKIGLDRDKNYHFEIIDFNGRILIREMIQPDPGNQTYLYLPDRLVSGVYCFRVSNGREDFTTLLVLF